MDFVVFTRKTKKEIAWVTLPIAAALIDDPGRNFWAEIKSIRNSKATHSRIDDGCSDPNSIAEVFESKYRSLHTSVPYDINDLNCISL